VVDGNPGTHIYIDHHAHRDDLNEQIAVVEDSEQIPGPLDADQKQANKLQEWQ